MCSICMYTCLYTAYTVCRIFIYIYIYIWNIHTVCVCVHVSDSVLCPRGAVEQHQCQPQSDGQRRQHPSASSLQYCKCPHGGSTLHLIFLFIYSSILMTPHRYHDLVKLYLLRKSHWDQNIFYKGDLSTNEGNICVFSCKLLHYVHQLLSNCVCLMKMTLWEQWEWTRTVKLQPERLNNELKVTIKLRKAADSAGNSL